MTLSLDSKTSEWLQDEVRFFIESHEAEFTRYGLLSSLTTLQDLTLLFRFSPGLQSALNHPGLEAKKVHLENALKALVEQGILLRFDGGPVETWRVRSRMGEMVRLLSLVRQRFRSHLLFSASKSLVQDVHYEVRGRRYPRRDHPLAGLWREMLLEGKGNGMTPQEAKALWDLLQGALNPKKEPLQYSQFQVTAFRLLSAWLFEGMDGEEMRGLVVGAGTGAGKTNTFFIPALAYAILQKQLRGQRGVKAIAVYPRIKLAQNQLETFLKTLYHLNGSNPQQPAVTIAIDYMGILYQRSTINDPKRLIKQGWEVRGETAVFPAAKCPVPKCEGELTVKVQDHPETPALTCAKCGRPEPHLLYVREDWHRNPPDFYVAVTESLNSRLLDSGFSYLFGEGLLADGSLPTVPGLLMLDEIHLHVATRGMQIGYLVRRLLARTRRAHRVRGTSRPQMAVVGLSATIAEPRSFFRKLTGIPEQHIGVVVPQEAELARRGSEYFIFVKANPEERTSAMSTLLQATMVLGHNMKQGDRERYLSLGFADSHDLVGRWEDQLSDAETQGLPALRDMSVPEQRQRNHQYFRLQKDACSGCAEHPQHDCVIFREGECWWSMAHRHDAIKGPLDIGVETSQRAASQKDLQVKDLVVATSRLEVGYDDSRIMAVVQYQAPGDAASFIQRKGRAGRDYGTHPITMMVLNPYRSQDAFYFKNPHLLTSPVFKELPLNPDNQLVQRVHGFYALFEALVGRAVQEQTRRLNFGSLDPQDADRMRRWTQGDKQLEVLLQQVQDALQIERDQAITVLARKDDGVLRIGLQHLVERIEKQGVNSRGPLVMKDYLPQNFFSDINLPQLQVKRGKDTEVMDLAPGLRTVMPGKVSWRGETPYWVPPVLEASGTHRWYEITAKWKMQVLPVSIHGQALPQRLSRRLDISPQQTLQVLRPEEVQVEDFQARKHPWYLSPEDPTVPWRNAQRPFSKHRLDERSVAHGLGFDRVTFDPSRLPSSMKVQSSEQVAERVFGPYGHRLMQRISFADTRVEPMTVLRATVGADMNLRWRGGEGYHETYGFQHNGNPVLLGYELQTEGIAFDFKPNLWSKATPSEDLAFLSLRAFVFFAQQELQVLGSNMFTAERLLQALVTTWSLQNPHLDAKGAAEALQLGEWRGMLLKHLQNTYHLKGDVERDVLALFDQDEVREALADAWLKAHRVEQRPFRDWWWDVKVMSLGQAMLLAAQSIAGVEVGQQLAVRVPLRLDHVQAAEPTLYLFEDGIGGLGVARSLHGLFKHTPMAFWDAVEHQLDHCPVGDEEDLLLAVLALPEASVEDIAAFVRGVMEANAIAERQHHLLLLQRHFQQVWGLDLTSSMVKGLLRVFVPPLEHWEQQVSNWRLYREINVVVRGYFETERHKHPNDHEVTRHVMEVLSTNPSSLPALHQISQVLQENHRHEWEAHLQRVQQAIEKPMVQKLFKSIPTLSDLADLEEMDPQDRQRWLKEHHDIAFTDPKMMEAFDQSYFQAEAELLWTASCWHMVWGQLEELKGHYLAERTRTALQREISKRYLNSCHSACPNCLEHGALAFADRSLLDRRATGKALKLLRKDLEVAVDAHPTLDQLLSAVRAKFRLGKMRCYVTYHLDQQPLVNQLVARLGEEGVRMEIGHHAVAVATTSLKHLGLPASRPVYEVGLELGETRL